jgi:PAS domain S-box-containing protein
MTSGLDAEGTDDGVHEPITVLVVGADAAFVERLEDRLSAAATVTVRVVSDVEAALDLVADADCVVRADGVVDESGAFLDAVRARVDATPVLVYAPIEETSVLLDVLAAGYTDVVPAVDADSVDVLGDRVLKAVRAARTRAQANEQDAALRAERDRFAALFENIPEPTVFYEIQDKGPVALDVNPTFERVFGYDAETVRGDVVDEYIVPADRRDEAAELNARVENGDHLDREVQRATADGDREFLLRDVPLAGDDHMRGYAIYTDITPQRERERRLREATSRLESQNERLEAFAGVVSHDLRNPLAVAMTYADLLEERYDDEDVDALQGALERMDDLIQDLLALAKQGTTVENRSLLDLETVAREASTGVATDGATLVVDADGAAVRANESRLRQLCENLFANAVEHGTTSDPMPSGDADGDGSASDRTDRTDAVQDGSTDDQPAGASSLTVRVGRLTDGEDRGFFIADDGVGIPEDERDAVFEYGYSGDDGTGFGLAIVKAIADAHDWTTTVEESASGGVRFAFTDVDLVV